jgi:hypothetical protein
MLPLGSVVSNKILVLHGGLPDDTTDLAQIRR